MPHHDVEAGAGKRQRGRLAAGRFDLEPELARARAERVEHARRDVGGGSALDHARPQEIDREVAGAGADLERVAERRRNPTERLGELVEHHPAGLVVEADVPLRVVVGGGAVVVGDVDRSDLLGGGGGHCRAEPIVRRALTTGATDAARYLQRDQPPGVEPLELTGERTLPDVPEENYWYRRHLVVYEWAAERCAGLDVVDLACGEGYGSAVLAERARSVVGVDANPQAHAHATARYERPGLRFERALVESFGHPCDVVVFLQTIEHVEDPVAVLGSIRSMLRPGGRAYVSTPNVLTLAPAGAERSGNPWHLREYRAGEFRELCETVFDHVELLGVFHARKLALHDHALRLGWDRLHPRIGVTSRFYGWLVPAITSSDFRLRDGDLDRALDFVATLS
jgi:SAM-dependent methyltransferase